MTSSLSINEVAESQASWVGRKKYPRLTDWRSMARILRGSLVVEYILSKMTPFPYIYTNSFEVETLLHRAHLLLLVARVRRN